MCDSDGHLQKLMLGGGGLSCPRFPPALGAFGGLRTLELEVASFGKDTAANAAKVRARARSRARASACCV